MGRRGPPPKPPELKRQQGTDKRHPERQADALVVPPGEPACPRGLTGDAKAVWDAVVPELLAIGTLAKVDGGILEGYCRMVARAVKLDRKADARPMVKTLHGPAVNPAGVEARKLWPVVEKFATDLGLHYAARSRVPAPKKQAVPGSTEDFLFGKQPLHSIPGGKSGNGEPSA